MRKATTVGLALAIALLAAAPAMATMASALEANAFATAEAEAQAALRKSPADAEASAWLARALYKQGKFAQAEAVLKKAPAGDPETLVARGDLALYTGQAEEAIRAYQQALAKAPKSVPALVGLASAHMFLENFDQAYDLAEAAEANAAQASAYLRSRALTVLGGAQGLKANKGNLGDKLKYGPRVKSTLEKAVATAPQNANAQYAMGRFYLLAPGLIGGDPAKSVAYFERATQLEPYYYPAQAWLVIACDQTGNKAKAAAELAEFKRKFSGLPEAMREVAGIKL